MDYRRYFVIFPSLTLNSIFALTPALARITDAFPQVTSASVQLLIAVPALVAFPVIILAGRLASVFTKKMITVGSLLLMLAGGTLPLLFHSSFAFLIACGVIFGLGHGAFSPISTALINEHVPYGQQGRLMGYQSAMIGIGGMTFAYVGGLLASYQWWYAYFTYLLLIPIILLALLIPKGILVPAVKESEGFFNKSLSFYLGQCVFATICFYVFSTNIALFVEEAGLGGPDMAGALTAAFSISGIAGGIFTGRILMKFRKYSLAFTYAITALGLGVIFFSHSVIQLVAGAVLAGFVLSIRMPAGYTKAIQSVPAAAATMAISVYCAANMLGQFLSPIVISQAARLIQDTIAIRFLLGTLLMLAVFLITMRKEYRTPGHD